jgi:protein subunit release factor B
MVRVVKSSGGSVKTVAPRIGHLPSWGHQIRSYVLQPYQLAIDLRTGVQTSDVYSVLDGDIDRFLLASLDRRAHGD